MSERDRILNGIPASRGVAIGRAYIYDPQAFQIHERTVPEEEVDKEVERFQRAIATALEDVIALQRRIAIEMGEDTGHIFRAHQAVLEDPEVIDVTVVRIRRERRNAESIFNDVMQGWISNMSAIQNPFFRERTADFEDVRARVLAKLMDEPRLDLEHLEEPVIIVAHNLSPSDTAELNRHQVCGFVTDVGGQTSHTAIVARGLAVPAVVGVTNATREITDGTLLIIDGNTGLVYLDPDPDTVRLFEETRSQLIERERELEQLHDLPAVTKDGRRVEISANIEIPNEVEAVLQYGADGIGLYRTEFLYLLQHGLPTEEDQYQAYLSIAQKMHPRSVIIRTLDLGTDKMPGQVDMPREANPALGFRGIRVCLNRRNIFKVQLRAILRASTGGNLQIMFPMISGLKMLRQAKGVLEEVRRELEHEDVPFDRNIPVGIMIEVPSAALTAQDLAREVDFFSIGTNDLIQYTLAVDRGNATVAGLYDPYDPAVLRLIASVVDAAHEQKIWVGVCGAMAGDPVSACILLGLGLDELSMSPIDIPEIKKMIRSTSYTDLQKMARRIITLSTSEEIHQHVQSFLSL